MIAVSLVLLTYVSFIPVLHCSFIDFDDPDYVTGNSHVQAGLTASSIHWAWTATAPAYYQPLSWLSLMLDSSLTGTGPEGYHRTNLLLHALSAGVVFLVLSRMTGTVWRAALVAALYALHPLRVESVAWVAERKDVLSNLLAWLTIGAYVGYARSPGSWRYLLLVVLFALAVLAKPMIVTLPFLLLLLDYWPLRRPMQVLEKIPLLIIALAAGAAAVASQDRSNAMAAIGQCTIAIRLGIIALGYALYLRNMVWFPHLAVLYPVLIAWTWRRIALAVGAGALLMAISLFCVARRREKPWLLVGWLWFVGVMFPVSGIFQAGPQLLADRFTYLPGVGLIIMIVWSIPASAPRRWIVPAAAAVLLILSCATWRQCGYWQDSYTLFTRDLAVADDNSIAHDQIGVYLYRAGDMTGAAEQCKKAIALAPFDPVANADLGLVLFRQGRLAEAIDHYRIALKTRPDLAQIHSDFALCLRRSGKLLEAYQEYETALKLDPSYEPGHANLAALWAQVGMFDKAADELRIACRLDPTDRTAQANLSIIRKLERTAAANSEF
jgi:protein O-mannosyl-transferase